LFDPSRKEREEKGRPMPAQRKAKLLFATERCKEIQIIRFKRNQLGPVYDLESSRLLLEFLDSVSADPTIKVVVFFGGPDSFSEPDGLGFFKQMVASEHEKRLARIFASIDQIVCKLQGMNQFVIHCSGCEVWGALFNISMACDYRIAGSQSVLKFSNFELGLIPKGGVICGLRALLGRGKTWELLLSEEGIDAYQAQAMGLVDLVLPSEYLVEDALNFAYGLCKAPSRLIRAAKRLINMPPVALSAILEKENEVIAGSILSERFRKQLEKNKRDAVPSIPWF
jgi:enoyl-CoA hydratase/carnithine racemase